MSDITTCPEARKPRGRMGKVYLVEAVGVQAVKIGFTSGCVQKRLEYLQTGSPHELRVVASVDADKGFETDLHKMLADYRIRGEWYDINGIPVGILVDGASKYGVL